MDKVWKLVRHPDGDRLSAALQLSERPMPTLQEGEVLIRNQYLSIDPGQRTWIRAEGSYMAPLALGSPMPGGVLGRVVQSRAKGLEPGELVSGMGQWAQHSVMSGRAVRKIAADPSIPAVAHMSALGPTGWTAYIGMLNVGRPQPGETVVVSAAAGAVGSVAGQIARIKGCRVIGIAGSDEKCRWLTQTLGFDGAINYQREDVGARLDELCPQGVDIYFENVGGEVAAAVYPRLAVFGRIILCGLASTYNGGPAALIDPAALLMKRARMEAFVVNDFFAEVPAIVRELSQWFREGRLQQSIDLVDGIENALSGLESLLRSGGRHMGKMLIKLREDDAGSSSQ